MFGKIKRYALALTAALGKFEDNSIQIPPLFAAPVFLSPSGKGRNKRPHHFTGVAASKRAARKLRRKKGR